MKEIIFDDEQYRLTIEPAEVCPYVLVRKKSVKKRAGGRLKDGLQHEKIGRYRTRREAEAILAHEKASAQVLKKKPPRHTGKAMSA